MLSINQRPKVLSEIIEQDIVVKQLKNKSRNCDFSTNMLFYYNETVEYFTPAAVSEYRNVQALPLIIYNSPRCNRGRQQN